MNLLVKKWIQRMKKMKKKIVRKFHHVNDFDIQRIVFSLSMYLQHAKHEVPGHSDFYSGEIIICRHHIISISSMRE